jgi:hypothetical protein
MQIARSFLACALAALLASTAGCGGSGVGGHPGNSYATGNGGRPQCGAFNQVCIAQKLDAPIALGATFEPETRSQIGGTSGPPMTLETADANVLAVEGTSLHAVGAGASAVLFVGPDKTVLDFLHVWVQPASELRVIRYATSGTPLGRVQPSFTLLVRDEILVSIEPFANGQPLLGNFKLVRDLQGSSIAIVPDSVSGWYRVVARAPGTTRVVFNALNLSTTLTIEVEP